MSRRGRALAFLTAALACAALAAAIANSYRDRVAGQYGGLRRVVVASHDLRAGKVLVPATLGAAVSIRRVPARFVPPGVLRRPADALGRAPGTLIPAGSYVLAEQLETPEPQRSRRPSLGAGRRPVAIEVTGAAALEIGGAAEGGRVDVVVSGGPGGGRTYVAAPGVRLLALDGPSGPGGGATATLALTRAQALDLIGAESSGRQIRLLPRPDS